MAPIPEHEFAALLRVTPAFLAQRRMSGIVHSDHCAGEQRRLYQYAITTVDGYMKDWTSPTKEEVEPPTYQKILEYQQNTGTVYFLTTPEVAAMLQCDITVVRRYIREGDLGALLLPGLGPRERHISRIPRPWVMEFILARTVNDATSYAIASKILGLHPHRLSKLVGPGRPLSATTVRGGSNESYVTTTSLKAYLGEPGRLVNCTPDEWWRLREDWDFEELLSRDNAASRYHASTGSIQSLVDDGTLPCLIVGVLDQYWQLRLPLHALQEWDEGRQLSASHAARMLGIPTKLAQHWMRLNLLCDIQHPEGDPCPRRSCFRRYIALHAFGKDITPSTWADTMSKTAPVMDDQILAHLPNFSAERLVVIAEDGKLSGIWLPTFRGGRRFIATAESATAFIDQESR